MTVTTLSSREFDQDLTGARKAASDGPVIITDRGEPAHVLLRIEDDRRLSGEGRTIPDLLAMPMVTRDVADFEATGVPLLNPWDAPR